MTSIPSSVFLDTNVYIIGVADPVSPEAEILSWIGYSGNASSPVEVIVSDELLNQIVRVSKRVKNKDCGSEILARIWQNLRLRFVLVDEQDFQNLEESDLIPREDVGIYLTAHTGKAQVFISSNHELIQTIAKKTGEFECLTPADFICKYLR